MNNRKFQFAKFISVGGFCAIIHFLIVFFLMGHYAANHVQANTIAFIVANIISFFLNVRFTFQSNSSFNRYIKFMSTSIIGMLIVVFISSISDALLLHYAVNVILILMILPVATFTIHNTWTFNNKNIIDRRQP